MATETTTDTESGGETTDVDASLRYGSTLMALVFAGLGVFGTVLTVRLLRGERIVESGVDIGATSAELAAFNPALPHYIVHLRMAAVRPLGHVRRRRGRGVSRPRNEHGVVTMAAAKHVAENKALVARFVDAVWNGEDLDAIEELATDDLVVHGLGADVDRIRQEFAEFHAGLLEAVPDLEHVVEDVVAENEQVVAYVTIRGTPERQYGALSPTGESFESVGFQKYRIEDGKIAEVWVLPNAMGMLRQLGIFPDSPEKVLRIMAGALKGHLLGR